jgi:hypothetical protein
LNVIYDVFQQIDQASLGLSREYLINKLDEPFVVAYHSYQVDLAVMFGADRARAEAEMKDALNFEIELAEVSFLIVELSGSKLYLLLFRFPSHVKKDATPKSCTTQ